MAKHTASSIVPSPDRSQKFGFFNRCPRTACELWNFLSRTQLQFPTIVFCYHIDVEALRCTNQYLASKPFSHIELQRQRHALCEFAQGRVHHSIPSNSKGKPMTTYSNFAVRDLLLRPGKVCARRRASQLLVPKCFTWATHACIA